MRRRNPPTGRRRRPIRPARRATTPCHSGLIGPGGRRRGAAAGDHRTGNPAPGDLHERHARGKRKEETVGRRQAGRSELGGGGAAPGEAVSHGERGRGGASLAPRGRSEDNAAQEMDTAHTDSGQEGTGGEKAVGSGRRSAQGGSRVDACAGRAGASGRHRASASSIGTVEERDPLGTGGRVPGDGAQGGRRCRPASRRAPRDGLSGRTSRTASSGRVPALFFLVRRRQRSSGAGLTGPCRRTRVGRRRESDGVQQSSAEGPGMQESAGVG